MPEDQPSGLKHLRNAAFLFALALIGGSLMLLPLLDRPLSVAQSTEPAPPTQNFFYVVITNTPDADAPTDQATQAELPSNNSTQPATQSSLSPTPFPLLVNKETGQTIPITWGEYPGPTTWPSYDIPPPIGRLPAPDSQVNIVLLGNDYKPRHGARTDMIMLLTLNPDEGTAALTSFPRDLYVYAPGWTLMKINTIQPRGGYELLRQTFEYNFGVRPDYFVNISVDSFVMDGPKAKWYVRTRNTTGDISRNQRQQAVLEAIFRRLMTLDAVNKAPQLFDLYARYVYTDLTLNAILPLAPLAHTLYADTTLVERHALTLEHAEARLTPIDGAYILFPNQNKVIELMLQVVEP